MAEAPPALDPLAVVRRRMAAQRLGGAPFATVAEAVAWSGGVQAQEYAEALWSLGMRVVDQTAADVEAACDRGEILRTHVMRPTWHFVAAADLRWLLRLTGERVQAKNAGRRRELGLDDVTLARCRGVFAAVLSDGEPRTRRELGTALEAAGIDPTGQRLPHVLGHVELDGLIASGPRRGKQHTYLLLDGRVPDAPERSREEDVAELVRRYFSSHGPATLRDFAWWSGLTLADARAGLAALEPELSGEEGADGTLWISAAAPTPAPTHSGAFLLGTFDELTVAHRDLRNVHADGRASNVLLPRPIVVDGVTVGGWTRHLAAREVTVEAVLDAALEAHQDAALRAAADRFGAFVGLPARLAARTG
ncbi:MAG TPA: winged helix DNA-binding domain-containing protein [Solirubrobacteraceae bacterium]|nr:winged helix DNA-binding domain-containing protein [Solirubrobacteraceae bacterium]